MIQKAPGAFYLHPVLDPNVTPGLQQQGCCDSLKLSPLSGHATMVTPKQYIYIYAYMYLKTNTRYGYHCELSFYYIYIYIYIHQLSLIHINYYEFQKKLIFFWSCRNSCDLTNRCEN